MKKLFYILLTVIIVSCVNDDFIEQVKEVKNLDPTRSTSVIEVKGISSKYIIKGSKGGYNGGLTSRVNLFAKTRSGKSAFDDGLLISQYPLVEFQYLQEVLYDSTLVHRIQIDTLTTYSIIDSTAIYNIDIDSTNITETVTDSIPIIENNVITGYNVSTRDTTYYNISIDTLGVSYEPVRDTIPTYDIQIDTISSHYSYNELSRDTIGFRKGDLWMPYNVINTNDFYIGIKKEVLDTLSVPLRMKVTMMDGIDSTVDGLLFVSTSPYEGVGYTRVVDMELTPDFYTRVDDIPTYDEHGKRDGSFTGIKMRLHFKHFKIVKPELIRHFDVEISTAYGNVVNQDFKIKFVEGHEYIKRLKWLNQEPGYQDAYTE